MRAERQRRVSTPTILQMEPHESGAASLAMVLAYFGRWLPLAELRVLCQVSRDGSKTTSLLGAAREIGLLAEQRRLALHELATLDLPAIVKLNGSHYVVLEGVDADHVHLNDPAIGRRKLGAAEFERIFSGLVLVFRKGENFQAAGSRRQVIKSLYTLASSSLSALVVIFGIGVLLVATVLVIPAFSRVFIDYFIVEDLHDWLIPLLIAMGAAALALALATWLEAHLSSRLQAKLHLVLSGRLTWHVLRLPPSFFTQRQSGMISARLPLADQIAELASRQLTRLVLSVTALVFFTALMLQYHVTLTIVCLLLASLNVLALSYLRRRLGEASEASTLQAAKMNGKVMQGLQSIETLKSTAADEAFFAQWAGLQALYANTQQRVVHWQTLLVSMPVLTGGLISATVLSLGGLYTIDDELTVGLLVAYIFIVGSFTAPLTDLVEILAVLGNAQGPLAQVEDTLRHPVAPEFETENHLEAAAATETSLPARLSGWVSLRHVSAGYSPFEPPLIHDVNLELSPGARVALVGATGSGKTTVGRIIAGLLEPWTGEVLFDGKPATSWPRHLLRHSLAVVAQDIVLFEGTIRENLSLFDDSLPLERIVRAARDAGIHEDIMARRGGYDAWVEEDGRNFSEGQRQRLEIARALACEPSILVLDEATSALDTLAERSIMNSLLRRGCTCVIIAHRLSTIRDCNEILVLDQGRIIERGTHEQLLQKGGWYRDLVQS